MKKPHHHKQTTNQYCLIHIKPIMWNVSVMIAAEEPHSIFPGVLLHLLYKKNHDIFVEVVAYSSSCIFP